MGGFPGGGARDAPVPGQSCSKTDASTNARRPPRKRVLKRIPFRVRLSEKKSDSKNCSYYLGGGGTTRFENLFASGSYGSGRSLVGKRAYFFSSLIYFRRTRHNNTIIIMIHYF